MHSQIRTVLFQVRNGVPSCLKALEKAKKRRNGPSISPLKVAEEIFEANRRIFRGETPSDQLLCFLLLLSSGNKDVLNVVNGLQKSGKDEIPISEALDILEEVMSKECEKCREQTEQMLEDLLESRTGVNI